jgi:VRR-NUC domain
MKSRDLRQLRLDEGPRAGAAARLSELRRMEGPRLPSMFPVYEAQHLHIPVVAALRRFLSPGWKFFHCPNGEIRSKRDASKLKAMGVLPGVPDLILFPPVSTAATVFLEFKRGSARLTDEQREFAAWARESGNEYHVVRTQEQAFDLFCRLGCWSITRTEQGFVGVSGGRSMTENVQDQDRQQDK